MGFIEFMEKIMDIPIPAERWLFDQMNEITIILDRRKRIVALNRSAEDFFGVKESEAKGLSCREVTCFDLCAAKCPFEEAVSCAESRKILDLESHRGAVCVNITPLQKGGEIVGAIETIQRADLVKNLADRLKQKQAKLQAEMERSETVLNSIADGIYTVDLQMHITAFSRTAEEMTGYREEDVIGKSCREILNSSVCETDCPLRWTLQYRKPVQNCSAVLIGKDGRRIPAFVSSDLLRDFQGEVCGCVGIIRDRSEVEALKDRIQSEYTFSDFVARSKPMIDIFDRIRAVAATDSTVLLQGESGTGKEIVARALHHRSQRKSGPFIRINCASLAENLLESELFGHVKGAFTGAIKDKPGRFELAEGGTLFLDEIGDTSLALQAKLLRVLQEREYERVGGIRTFKSDVRVIAATNKDLLREIERGNFREDLYYRLCVVPIHLPPLRRRKEDIPLLVEKFIEKFNARGKRITEISSRAMALLIEYEWPGNVRELENAIEHAFVTSTTGRIERQFLPATLRQAPAPAARLPAEAAEEEQILRALELQRWNRNEAARKLGMSRTTLWRRLKRMGEV
jgi:PAS domain S-box-containing protein